MARVDYDRQARRYEAGRGVPLGGLEPWRAHVERALPPGTAPIADIGAGTGTWTRAFCAWFDARVIAVEPSAGMREVGVEVGIPGTAAYVAACAEALPLRDASCRGAWLSTVIHHLDDITACARELRRVLLVGAPVMIRNTFPDRHDEVELFRHFDAAARVALKWPRLDDVVGVFAEAGFRSSSVVRVHEARFSSLKALRGWALAMRHTDSTLVPISNAEFAKGLAQLDDAIARGESPRRSGTDLVTMI